MPKVNQTAKNNRRKASLNRLMPARPARKLSKIGDDTGNVSKRIPDSSGVEKKATGACFWEVKGRLTDSSEDKSPYEHMWDFLTKWEGMLLAAYKKWPYYGRMYNISKVEVARCTKDYLSNKGIEKMYHLCKVPFVLSTKNVRWHALSTENWEMIRI